MTEGGPLGGVVVGPAAGDAVDGLAGELAGGGVLRGGRRRGLGGDVGVGAVEPDCTVIVTLAGLLVSWPLLTVSWKVRVAELAGAVKVGLTAVELERVTVGPAVCVQL